MCLTSVTLCSHVTYRFQLSERGKEKYYETTNKRKR